jgi:hypothetical protein
VSFIVCVVLCAVFRLIVVSFCVTCVICLLCLIVLPLPPDKNPFAIKINNSNNINIKQEHTIYECGLLISEDFTNSCKIFQLRPTYSADRKSLVFV